VSKFMNDTTRDNPHDPKKQAVRIRILIGLIEEQQMALVMTSTQQCLLTMQPLDAKGNPAKVDGIPEWQVSNPGVCTIQPAADGITAMCLGLAIGDTQVNCTADADLGSGTRSITGLIDVSIRAAEAVSIGIVAGTPEEQPTSGGASGKSKK
jgi:hypothetical protein